jgi:hypothetical protein
MRHQLPTRAACDNIGRCFSFESFAMHPPNRLPARLPHTAGALLLAALCAPSLAAEPAVTDWAAAARRDIEFAGATMRTTHAGVAGNDPSVVGPLETGLRLGLAEAATVRDEQDYRRLMMRFIAGFGDPHTGIDVRQTVRGWTGMLVDQVEGRYRVVWTEPGWPSALPPLGAVVESCDGVWFGTWLKTQVSPFVVNSLEYLSTFSALAQAAMLDRGMGWTPKTCVFTLADGSRKTYALSMRSVAEPAEKARLQAAQGKVRAAAAPVGMKPLGPGKTWVSMPSFYGKDHGPAYEALYPKLAALPKSGWVVFDLRGNGGVNSAWGKRALAALFSDAYANRLAQSGGLEKYMVATPESAQVLKRYIASPEFAASREDNIADLAKVEAAIRAGQKLALVSGEPGAAERPVPALVRPHGPRIAALIDRNCFSSCMNFVQQIRTIADSVVLGEATIGYSPYGETSVVPLPSGQGSLYIPTALFKTTQATRAPFLPDVAYTGNMADDAALARWVGATLDRIGARPR